MFNYSTKCDSRAQLNYIAMSCIYQALEQSSIFMQNKSIVTLRLLYGYLPKRTTMFCRMWNNICNNECGVGQYGHWYYLQISRGERVAMTTILFPHMWQPPCTDNLADKYIDFWPYHPFLPSLPSHFLSVSFVSSFTHLIVVSATIHQHYFS